MSLSGVEVGSYRVSVLHTPHQARDRIEVHRRALFGIEHEAVVEDAGHSQVFVRLGQSQVGGSLSGDPALTCDQVVYGQAEGVDVAGHLHWGSDDTIFPL